MLVIGFCYITYDVTKVYHTYAVDLRSKYFYGSYIIIN
jgi:hypothetical protein